MSSGVTVADNVNDLFKNVKMKQSEQNCLVLKMSADNKYIIVDDDYKFKGNKPWKNLLEDLPKDDARYVIYDFNYKPDTRSVHTSKLIFLQWCPDCVSVKTKMLYASSKDAAKRLLGQEVPMFQADCCDDCEESVVLSKLNKFN